MAAPAQPWHLIAAAHQIIMVAGGTAKRSLVMVLYSDVRAIPQAFGLRSK